MFQSIQLGQPSIQSVSSCTTRTQKFLCVVVMSKLFWSILYIIHLFKLYKLSMYKHAAKMINWFFQICKYSKVESAFIGCQPDVLSKWNLVQFVYFFVILLKPLFLKKQSVNVMLQRHSKAESLVDLLPMLSIISQRSPQYEPIERVKNLTLDQRVQVMMWKLTFTIDESNSPKVVVCFINLFSICVQQSHTWTLYTQRKTLMQAWRPSCNFLTGSSGNKAIKTSYVQRSIEQFSAQLLAI